MPLVTRQMALRDSRLIGRLDEAVDALRDLRPGRRISREGLARELLDEALRDPKLTRRVGLPSKWTTRTRLTPSESY